MWSLRTVATYVLLMVLTAKAGLVPEMMTDEKSLNETVYYKPQAKRNVARDPLASRSRHTQNNNEERLSKMSSLDPKFWVYAQLAKPQVNPDWNFRSDCFYKSRKSMRWYPEVKGAGKCYQMDFSPPRRNAWWNFWPEIRGDLQYAFDFVMWDEYELYHETNSFWYLMLYLKTLLKRIHDPNLIAHSERPMFDSRRRGNETMLRATKAGDSKPVYEEHEPLRELLTEYQLKLKHLESLISQ